MTPTQVAAAAAKTMTPPAAEPAATHSSPEPAAPDMPQALAPWQSLAICAAEIGLAPDDLSACGIWADVSHLLPGLLTDDERARLVALDEKNRRHLASVEAAYALPKSALRASEAFAGPGLVPTPADFASFDLATERRRDRVRIAKVCQSAFRHSELDPFLREIFARAALRLQKVIADKRASDEETYSKIEKELSGDVDFPAWVPSRGLRALARRRAALLDRGIGFGTVSVRDLLRGAGLSGLLPPEGE